MDMHVEKNIVFELNGRSVEAIEGETILEAADRIGVCLLYTSPSPRDRTRSRMPSSA